VGEVHTFFFFFSGFLSNKERYLGEIRIFFIFFFFFFFSIFYSIFFIISLVLYQIFFI
jgi:hypothetical protein